MNVIITGASQGIGRAIAERFAAAGADLFLCSRQEKRLQQAVTEMQDQFAASAIHSLACDLSKRDEVSRFSKWLLEQTRTIDVLVNNAGSFVQGNVHDEAEGNLEEMIATNLYSAYWLTRDLIAPMKETKAGHIFNMCSIASLKAYPQGGSYSISKYALAGFSANLRDELRPHKIKVTSVFPGAVWTASWAGSGIAEDRIMKATDIAQLIFAASSLSPQACVEEIVVRPQLGDL